MRGKITLSLAGVSIGLLLVAGLLYWSLSENTPSVAPKGSAEISPAPQASAPTPSSPSAPAAAQSDQATPPPAPTATSPSAPPATAQSDQAAPPPTSTATSPVIPMPAETGMSEAQRRQVQEALGRL